MFGDRVGFVSLESDITVYFEPVNVEAGMESELEPLFYRLQRRSLLLLTGESRTKWKHGIKQSTHDMVNGKEVGRLRSLRLTMRALAKQDE